MTLIVPSVPTSSMPTSSMPTSSANPSSEEGLAKDDFLLALSTSLDAQACSNLAASLPASVQRLEGLQRLYRERVQGDDPTAMRRAANSLGNEIDNFDADIEALEQCAADGLLSDRQTAMLGEAKAALGRVKEDLGLAIRTIEQNEEAERRGVDVDWGAVGDGLKGGAVAAGAVLVFLWDLFTDAAWGH